MNMDPVALQLYSIKELTQVDFLGTLEKVAKMGYDGVEFAGYFDTSAKDLKKVLNGVGLQAAGSHIGIDALKSDLERSIDYALEIENPYIICPGIPEEMRSSKDDYIRTADFFNKVGQRCKENGIQFGYHNHDFEFEQFNGVYGLDLLVNHTEKALLFVELDTYWVEFSGLRSIDFIEKYGERCRILHIKDMKSLADKRNTEIGAGIMDFKSIIPAGQKQGVQWYTVEQEEYEIPQLRSIQESLNYLKSLI
jgi:sugar phosphate isomerase/epimerase